MDSGSEGDRFSEPVREPCLVDVACGDSEHCFDGGASYDALIAATATRHNAILLTRDELATAIYELMGADVRWVAT